MEIMHWINVQLTKNDHYLANLSLEIWKLEDRNDVPYESMVLKHEQVGLDNIDKHLLEIADQFYTQYGNYPTEFTIRFKPEGSEEFSQTLWFIKNHLTLLLWNCRAIKIAQGYNWENCSITLIKQ